jgi:hypothetical protein
MFYHLVYSQDASGNSEMYDDHFTPEKAADQRQHISVGNGIRARCGRHTRSKGQPRDESRELCQTCLNKQDQAERKQRYL